MQGLTLNILVATGAIHVNEQFTTYTAADVAEGLQVRGRHAAGVAPRARPRRGGASERARQLVEPPPAQRLRCFRLSRAPRFRYVSQSRIRAVFQMTLSKFKLSNRRTF